MNQHVLLNRLNELPRIESLLQELLEMVNQEQVDFAKLAKKISMDQVLSARLLRLANSVHFGCGKNVATVNDAIIRVGMGAVRTLVVASVLASSFPKISTLDMDGYWADTFEVAVIGSKLAEKLGVDANETFTTGVLHNIGELMIHTLEPDVAVAIQKRVDAGEDPFDVEEELLHVSCPILGAQLARTWKFPEEMANAIEHFSKPIEADISPKLATILHFARQINSKWDSLIEPKDKLQFFTTHPDARLLNISEDFIGTIDQVRGNGRELAMQMNA
jgi:HD-like signal output (HDOD) protein